MTQYAVPESDDAIGSWTNESGGTTNLHDSVDDVLAPNDTDYIQAAMAPVADTVRLKLSSAFHPGSGTTRLRLRGKWDTPPPTGGNVAFVWDAVPTATTYKLQVGTSSGGAQVFNYFVGNVLTYSVSLTTGTYYSRVLAYNGTTYLSTSGQQTVSVS